jgi:hypothetical protein
MLRGVAITQWLMYPASRFGGWMGVVAFMRRPRSIEMETFCFFEKTLVVTTQSTKSLEVCCWNQNFRPAILRSL